MKENREAPVTGLNTDTARLSVLLIEQSASLSMLLAGIIESEMPADVVVCASLAAARQQLKLRQFTVAISARTLPDAPNGAIVALLERNEVPFILLAATFDPTLRKRFAKTHLVDYFVKDNTNTARMVVEALKKFISNHEISVLVVDDSVSGRSRLTDILRRQNYTVHQVNSGAEAMEMIDQLPVEIVIVDYYMPGMDGYELIRKIREHYSSDLIRLIGVSASSDRFLSSAFLKAGASDFLYRPFVPEELQCRLDNHVETLKQIRNLRFLAEHDPLTGLYNRRAFFGRSNAQIRDRSARNDAAMIAVLDIDFFKRINDRFGHDTGDEVLKGVANILSAAAMRANMIAARLGGEEFVLMMPDTSAEDAFDLCEAIRLEIENHSFGHQTQPIDVTVSFGIAGTDTTRNLSATLRAADQMLYQAKSSGRNRVCSETNSERLISYGT